MWELIANGLNLAGNLASVGSFISSYSVDRDRKIIDSSILNIEKHLIDLDKILADNGKPEYLEKYISNLIDSKKQSEITGDQILHALNSTSRDQEKLVASLNEFLLDIKGAYQLKKSEYKAGGKDLLKELLNNPFNAGVSQFWDITGINSIERFPGKIISSASTPILWSNPSNRQQFLGEMHNSSMHQFGLNVHVPHYKFNQDGYIYDNQKGLYLPSFMFSD